MTPLRVLLVEDSPTDAKLVEAQLRKLGRELRISIVEDAASMRHALAHGDIDLVISDWSLPRFSAPDALRVLAESGRDLPFIIVSGTVGEELAVQAMRAGAHDYVLKDKLARLGPAVDRELREAEIRNAERRARDELARQEARFRLLIERSSDGITLTDRAGVVTYVSPATARMFGYDADAIIGRRMFDLLDGADRERLIETMAAVRREPGATMTHVLRARRGDGSACWIEARTKNLLDDPAVAAIVGNLRDITDERRMTEELRASEERYRRIVETTGEGVWTCDADGVLTYANRRLEAMLGAPAPLAGRLVADVLGDELYRHVRTGTTSASHRQLELALRRADGSTLQCVLETSAFVGADGRYAGTLGMVMDVTALRVSEHRLSRVVEAGIVGICFANLDGRIEDANDTYLSLLGYSREDLAAGRISWRDMMPASTRDDDERITQMLFERGSTPPFERELFRKDRSILHVLCGLARLEDHKLVVFIADLSAQKRAEAALRHTQAQLLQAQKMEAIGRLAGGVAHDFNNVLSVILTQSEMLLDDPQLAPALQPDVEEVRRAGRRAADLTKQLLMFSRQQVVEPTVFALDQLLRDLETMLRRLVGEDVRVTVRHHAEPGYIRADRGQIEQVVMNLVVNARDAMPRGGEITIESAPVDVTGEQAESLIGLVPGPHVKLVVRDTGHGMPPDVIARIYEPFFTTKEKGRGTGLGLSTVFGIVSASGGTIHVDSAVGAGTTFCIYFPRADRAAAVMASPGPVSSLRGHEVLLLAEDEESVRAVTAGILRRAGYIVHAATDVDDALRIAQDTSIDALITDVVMPGVSGPDLAERLRKIRPGIAVLCMSGYIDDAMIRERVTSQGFAFVQKPITPEPLLLKLRHVLDARTGPR